MTTTDLLKNTHVAALQHDLVNGPTEATLVEVVRRPTGWFRTMIDESHPPLCLPTDLLDDFKQRHKNFKMQRMWTKARIMLLG